MITRSELLQSPEYWFEEAQNELYRQVTEYMENEKLNQTQLAQKLNVTKGYISQILNGEFNYTLKKLIELSLAIGRIPAIEYKPISDVLLEDDRIRFFSYTGAKTPLSLPMSKTGQSGSTLSRESAFMTVNASDRNEVNAA